MLSTYTNEELQNELKLREKFSKNYVICYINSCHEPIALEAYLENIKIFKYCYKHYRNKDLEEIEYNYNLLKIDPRKYKSIHLQSITNWLRYTNHNKIFLNKFVIFHIKFEENQEHPLSEVFEFDWKNKEEIKEQNEKQNKKFDLINEISLFCKEKKITLIKVERDGLYSIVVSISKSDEFAQQRYHVIGSSFTENHDLKDKLEIDLILFKDFKGKIKLIENNYLDHEYKNLQNELQMLETEVFKHGPPYCSKQIEAIKNRLYEIQTMKRNS